EERVDETVEDHEEISDERLVVEVEAVEVREEQRPRERERDARRAPQARPLAPERDADEEGEDRDRADEKRNVRGRREREAGDVEELVQDDAEEGENRDLTALPGRRRPLFLREEARGEGEEERAEDDAAR